MRRFVPRVLLVLLAGTLTITLQWWVGGVTLYRADLAERREVMHQAVLHNELPEGAASWRALGLDGVNTRVAAVYLAEGIHRASGMPATRAYFLIDTVALFASFLLLFALLRRSSPPAWALVGMLWYAAVLPLTYFFAYFHPWDRLALVCWLGLLLLLRAGRLLAFTALLVLSVTVKYDVLLLPGLYFLATVTRDTWRRVTVTTAAMFAAAFGTWIALRVALPGGYGARDPLDYLARNLDQFLASPHTYPPLLALGLPMLLALAGWRASARFERASTAFAILLCIPLLLSTLFIEVRAEMPVLVLLMPGALAAARREDSGLGT